MPRERSDLMPRGIDPVKLQEWMERFDRFRKSGQSARRFCASENVSQPSFYQWKQRISTLDGHVERQDRKNTSASNSLGRQSIAKATAIGNGSSSESTSSSFQSVQITPVISGPQNTTIRLPSGVEIELGSDLQVVESIIKLLLDAKFGNGGTASC